MWFHGFGMWTEIPDPPEITNELYGDFLPKIKTWERIVFDREYEAFERIVDKRYSVSTRRRCARNGLSIGKR
jgi:hypothetical protein